MKNVLDQKPTSELSGRLKGCAEFVERNDLQERSVLDIGCGFGSFVLYALEQGAQHVTGIEVTEQDLATAKQSIRDSRTQFQVASALQLPFEDGSFDTVTSFDVIEHLPKETEVTFFSEVNRVLKTGGVFYLSTPLQSVCSNIVDPAWWFAGHRHYSQKQLEQYGKQCHFSIEEVQTKGSWWSAIAILTMYVSKWILRRPPLFQSFLLKKEDREYARKNGFINILVRYKKQPYV